MIISTEYQGHHQDWRIPDEEEALLEWLDDLDGDESPHGSFVEQVGMRIRRRFDAQSGTIRSLVLPVDAATDITIDFKVE